MTNADAIATKAVIAAVEPQLFDIVASYFFVTRLGFSVVFTYGEPPY
jgi:hypothetical protein